MGKKRVEKKIKEEICKRVLDREQVIHEIKENKLEEKAELEALEEITDVPRKEIKKIAKQIHADFELKKKRRKTYLHIGFALLICGLIGFSIWLFIYLGNKNISYSRSVFCTAIKDYKPSNIITEATLDTEYIYIYTTWISLPIRKHTYRVRIYDGNNRLIRDSAMKLKPQGKTHNTWSWYHPNTQDDIPGKWKFEVFMNGMKKYEKFLLVM